MTRAVTDIIREIDRGKFAEAITDELSKLVPACRDTGAVGELTISLKLKPGKGGSAVVEVIPSYKVKQPKTEVPTEIFFATESGALIRDNPDQGKLELEVVQRAQAQPIAVTTPGQVPVRQLMDPKTGELIEVRTASPNDPTPGAASA